MTQPSSHQKPSDQPSRDNSPSTRRSPLFVRVLKILGLTIVGIIVVIIAAITVAVNYLRPEKLTPIVERIANDNLKADVTLKRVEISFWSTFPRFDADIQGLKINTQAFDGLPDSIRQQLPPGADSLLSIDHLSAAVNIPRLLKGDIKLYDISITHPVINLVQATPEAWSLDIFHNTEKEDTAGIIKLPHISLGTFAIEDSLHVSYRSLPDSISASATLGTLRLEGEKAPAYRLDISGVTSARTSTVSIAHVRVGLGGNIDWDIDNPLRLSLNDWKAGIGNVDTEFSTSLDFEHGLTLETLDFSLPATPLNDIIAVIPHEMRGELEKIKANLDIALKAHLITPYTVGVDTIPSATVSLSIPEGTAEYDGMKLNRFELQAVADINGSDPDASTLSISRLLAQGQGVGFLLTGNVSHPLSDPLIDGNFRGGLNVQRLPKKLLSMIPATIQGDLRADCDFILRRSYLDRNNFHKIRLKGSATLKGLNVDMPILPAHLFARTITLQLGTNSRFVRDEVSVDSLLTASLSIDTISAQIQGFDVRSRGLKAGVGTRNTSQSADTTQINPIGGRVLAERFSFRSQADSTRIHMRNALIAGVLRRYNGNSRQPELGLTVSTDGALYGDRLNRAMLSNVSARLRIHPSDSRSAQRRFARLDSLRRTNPTATRARLKEMSDSITQARRIARMEARADSLLPISGTVRPVDNADIEVNGSLRQLLRTWSASGSLKAERMRAFTPYFPIANRVDGLDIEFSTDSIKFHETRVRIGRSAFTLNGEISNITQSLTSRRGRKDLIANFNLDCDTIDVNQIAGAVFAGAAFTEKDSLGLVTVDVPVDENADENSLQQSLDRTTAQTDSASVLLIPANLEATFAIHARHIVYSDLVFHDFTGTVNAFGGALNLAQLGAHSDIGSIGLNALYTAPSRHDATFAFGLTVDRFRIRQFLNLVPSIDSLMPLLQELDGVVNADIAATTQLDSAMNIDIPSLRAAVKLSGDSLVVMNDETFRKIGKWLMFKHKERNLIDSMTVEMVIANSQMQMFPFMFNLDRYKLGVEGTNDLSMNMRYHIAVIKSPIPFKFGINISGTPDNMKIRLGKAKFNEKSMARTVSIADTTRVNLVQEIRNLFRRGIDNARVRKLDFGTVGREIVAADLGNPPVGDDTLNPADSAYLRRQGLLPENE